MFFYIFYSLISTTSIIVCYSHTLGYSAFKYTKVTAFSQWLLRMYFILVSFIVFRATQLASGNIIRSLMLFILKIIASTNFYWKVMTNYFFEVKIMIFNNIFKLAYNFRKRTVTNLEYGKTALCNCYNGVTRYRVGYYCVTELFCCAGYLTREWSPSTIYFKIQAIFKVS